jgi:hypothetical protein
MMLSDAGDGLAAMRDWNKQATAPSSAELLEKQRGAHHASESLTNYTAQIRGGKLDEAVK